MPGSRRQVERPIPGGARALVSTHTRAWREMRGGRALPLTLPALGQRRLGAVGHPAQAATPGGQDHGPHSLDEETGSSC